MIPGTKKGEAHCPHPSETAVRVGFRLAYQCQSCGRIVVTARDLRPGH